MMETPRYLRMNIVCRHDLNMPTGKFGAMVAHAAMTFIVSKIQKEYCFNLTPEQLKELGISDVLGDKNYRGPGRVSFYLNENEARWLSELDPGLENLGQVSFAKIVLQVNSEEELLDIEKKAKEAKLEVHRVVDSGHSHNKPGTLVCIAIGPDWPEKLQPVTGHLKVYR